MKIIGWQKKGNVVRFALGEDDLNYYWGDDFDDAPYEHNAGAFPYSEYVSSYIDIAFYYYVDVMEAADDWHYNGNSPYCMKDFIDRKAPILILNILPDEYSWSDDYSLLIGAANTDEFHKIYMGDNIDTVIRLANFGIILA